MQKHFIMGTAGHVDHGKTALIKALTNFNCDTHKEEIKRGITINLGFTHIKQPDDSVIGIIDVPGHKDFINTMISGACGINLVLFVIAADSGIMPQTREHLQILNALGIKYGIIALTKSDLAEPILIDIAKEEIKSLVKNTFLEKAPIQEVSSITGDGIDKLKNYIYELTSNISGSSKTAKNNNEPLRIYIDRIFSPSGVGTIVTGSIKNGNVTKDKNIFLIPAKNKIAPTIKNIHKYGQSANIATAGERVAINLSGFKNKEYRRGMILSDIQFKTTKIIDAEITLYENPRSKKYKTNTDKIYILNCLFLTGTLETNAKVKLLFKSCDYTEKDKSYYVQIRLEKEAAVRYNDKFILRNSSSNKTIGFGTVINPSPLHHKRRTEKLNNEFKNISKEGIDALFLCMLSQNNGIANSNSIAHSMNMRNEEVINLIDSKNTSYITIELKDTKLLVEKKRLKKLKKDIPLLIKKHHIKMPLSPLGITTAEIINSLKLHNSKSLEKLIEHILKNLKAEEIVQEKNNTWSLSTHKILISTNLEEKISAIEKFLRLSGMTVPLADDLKNTAQKNEIHEKELNQILKHLAGTGKIYKIENSYIHSDIINSCRSKLINYLNTNKNKGVTVAEFRDIVKGNRKICLLLLAVYDKEETTTRKGDLRFLA